MASPTQMCPCPHLHVVPLLPNKSCYATWRVRVLSGICEQLLGVGMTPSLGRRRAYEKNTLLQTTCLPLGESGVWGSKIPPAVKEGWWWVGTTRMKAPKHWSYWKVPATSLQISCLEPTHATDHACRGPWWWIKGCISFLHHNHQLRKFCSTQFSSFHPERPAARI